MFGIGLPEMLLIMALALIVIGPDKLPDLARSLAKGLMELKKTAESLKTSFAEEGNPLDEIRPELEKAAQSLKNDLLSDTSPELLEHITTDSNKLHPAQNAAEAYEELMKQTGTVPNHSTPQIDPHNKEAIQSSEPERPSDTNGSEGEMRNKRDSTDNG